MARRADAMQVGVTHEGGVSGTVERRVLDGVPALVGYWRTDETCAYANPHYAKQFGRDPEAVMGMTIREVLGEEAYAVSRPHLDAVFSGQEQHFERSVVDEHGVTHHTEVTYVPDVVDGVVVGLILHIVDVTARVEANAKARHNAALHRVLAGSLPDTFVVAFDTDLVVTLVDGPACALFGLVTATAVGRPLGEVLPDIASDLQSRWPGVLSGDYVCWDRVISGRTMALRAAPLDDGGDSPVTGGLVVGTDVTVERRRQTTAEALQRIAVATASGAGIDTTCEMIAAEARSVFNGLHATVTRFDAGRVETVALVPALDGVPTGSITTVGEHTLSGRVALSDRPSVMYYADDDGPRARAALASGMCCGVGAPIRVQGVLWGAVAVGLVRAPRDEAALLRSIEAFADAAGLAISSAAAWQRLEAEAVTDHLTGLANRRQFDLHLDDEVAIARRARRPVSVVVFDLDGFKQVNDTLGHPAGDALLQQVAGVAAACVRHGELLARTGGDEFAVVVRGGAREAQAAARRLATALAPVSGASFGTATLTGGAPVALGTSPSAQLLAEADADLYQHKRNRTRTSTRPVSLTA